MKGSWKRVMSGVLSVLTIATTVFQPITTYAAEPDNTASFLNLSIRNWKR